MVKLVLHVSWRTGLALPCMPLPAVKALSPRPLPLNYSRRLACSDLVAWLPTTN